MTTHLRALRAARRVTATSQAVARTTRRVAVRTALGVALLLGPVGCSSDPVEPAASPPTDDVSVVDAMASEPDTAALLDDIMNPSTDVGTTPVDIVATEDAGPNPEDVAAVDAGSMADLVAAEGTCFFPTGEDCLTELQTTGMACETSEACSDWTGADTVCVDGTCERFACDDPSAVCYSASCHAGQGHSDQELSAKANACCNEIWEGPEPVNGVVLGCTPWGPPAPPEDRGYRLSEWVG